MGNSETKAQASAVCLIHHQEQEVCYDLGCSHSACLPCWQAEIERQLISLKRSPLGLTCFACKHLVSQASFKELANQKSIDYLAEVLKTIPEHYPPTALKDFGYSYVDGELRSESGKPFHFINQNHYEALGDAVIPELYNIMETKYHFKRVLLPVDSVPDEPTIPIFVSENAMTAETLIFLLQGSGAVRPGMWARALCINNSLNVGSIFPYIEQCQQRGWGVVVLNPNENYAEAAPQWSKADFLTTEKRGGQAEKRARIRENGRPQSHTVYMWDHFAAPSQAKQIGIVAHSAGGACTSYLLEQRLESMNERLRVVAFTDAVGVGSDQQGPADWLAQNSVNFVTSTKPLGTPLKVPAQVPCVSAGHEKHEWTSGIAITEVFKLLDQHMN